MAEINISKLGIKLNEGEIFQQIGLVLKDKIGGTGNFYDYEICGDSIYNRNSLLADKLSEDENAVKAVKLAKELQNVLSALDKEKLVNNK